MRNRRARDEQIYRVRTGDVETCFCLNDDYSRWYFSRWPMGQLYEEQVTQLVLRHMSPSTCFVDVGANLGWYTCVVAGHAKDGRVVALELDESNCDRLKKNIALNGNQNVDLVRLAVSDCAGVGYYRRCIANSALLRLDPTIRESDGDYAQVRTDTIDSVLDDRGVSSPDIVKIDVEGAEFQVLKGMSGTLARGRPVLIIEYHRTELSEWGASSSDLIRFLERCSYTVYELQQGKIPGARRALRRLRPPSYLAGNCVLYAVTGNPLWDVQD